MLHRYLLDIRLECIGCQFIREIETLYGGAGLKLQAPSFAPLRLLFGASNPTGNPPS
jgi:hypothetical protein